MNTKPYTLLMLVDSPFLRDAICAGLVDHPYNVILASSLEEAQSIVQTRDISCILVTDKHALYYDQASNRAFHDIAPSIPTLMIFREGHRELFIIFDQYYRPASALYRYLPLPVDIDEIAAVLGRMIATKASQT